MGAGTVSPGRRQYFVALALVAVVALAGCSLLSPNGGETGGLPPGEEAADEYRSLDGYEATVHYEYSDRPDRKAFIQEDIDSGRSRVEWLEPASRTGSVQIYNGSAVIRYNATENEYVRIDTTDIQSYEDGAEHLESSIDAARKEGTTTVDQPPGGAPLPRVPQGNTAESVSTGTFEVSYDGTETVAGREAHVISYDAVGDVQDGTVSQTVWLDTEHFFTLKSTQVSRFGGEKSTFTVRLSNVTVEPGLSAADFDFDPPANATLNRSASYDVTGYDSRAQLVDAAAISVPNPTVPDRFTLFRTIRVVGQNFTAVQLQYQTSSSRLLVTKTSQQSYTSVTDGERVSVGSRTGRYRTSGTRAIVVWQCDEFIHTVTGDVQKTTLLDVARSVECE
jgi:outer membrane lipoprotein-sorting protein